MRQEIYDLYDQYAHYGLDRREFLQKLAVMAGGLVAAETLLKLLESNAARAQTVAARDSMLANRNGVRAKVQAELAKAEPDLAAIASTFEGVEEQGRALRRQARDQWLKVYASLRADQKAIVRDELKARFDRMESMHERMKERRGPKAS